MAAVKATHAMISAARHCIHFSHSVSQGGLYVSVIVAAWNCKLPHLIHMFPTNIYSHLCTVYKQELSQQTMSLRMQTWLATLLSTTMYNRIVAKNSITTSALSVNGGPFWMHSLCTKSTCLSWTYKRFKLSHKVHPDCVLLGSECCRRKDSLLWTLQQTFQSF